MANALNVTPPVGGLDMYSATLNMASNTFGSLALRSSVKFDAEVSFSTTGAVVIVGSDLSESTTV